jgi:putative DNA primase/helicase
MGYCLTGSTREEAMFIFWGGGCNGKTVFIETMRSCVGPDYAIELSTNALVRARYGDDPERALVPLPGIRLATTTELREGQQLNAQLVKRITSGEPVRVRALYKESSEFHPECKVIMATNHKPRVSEDDEGTWRRLLLIPFNQKIPDDKINRNLRAELLEELPGVFAWMVRGCREYQKNGLKPPKSVLAATQEYRSDEDFLSEFLDAYCSTEDPQAWVSSSDLGAAFGNWFKRSGGKYVPSPKAIAERLKQRGFVSKKRGIAGWCGLDLTKEAKAWLELTPEGRVSKLIKMEREAT